MASSIRKRRLTGTSVLTLWFLPHYMLLVVALPLNWGRYYLPAVIALNLVTATELHRWAKGLRSRFTRPAAPPAVQEPAVANVQQSARPPC